MWDKEEEFNTIKLAQGGDKDAYNKVIKEYTPYIKSLARKYFLVGAEMEDIMQIGFLSLCEAINRFNLESNVRFITYLHYCVNGDLKNQITKSQNNKQKALNESISLDIDGDDDNENSWAYVLISTDLSPEDEVITKQKVKEVVNLLKQNLKDDEKQIIQMYLQGYKYSEIASATKVSEKKVDNVIAKAKRIISKLKKDEYL